MYQSSTPNVLSLFDGMSCGQIALKEAGIPVNRYYASEVDKHAIKQTQFNFQDTIQLGDVRNVDVNQLDHIHLLIGGSPCQSFSFAGKRKGMATKCEIEITKLEQYLELKEQGFEFEGQSYLFWEYMRILTDIRKYNPDVLFLLENVEMVAKWERTLSEAIGVWPVRINSALVSAQNRKRLYWTNIRTKRVGLFGELYSDIPQPIDRGILLRDILESEVDEKYYLSEKAIDYLNRDSLGNYSDRLTFMNYENKNKSTCITQNHHKGVPYNMICVSMVGRKTDENGTRKDNDPNLKAVQPLEPNLNGKTNSLTSVQKDNLVMHLKSINNRVEGVSFHEDGIRPHKGDYRKSGIQELGTIALEYSNTSCLTTNHEPKAFIGNRIRRLTPLECSRLQTIPAWYKWACSDTQQYRMLGNGWTVEVIKHIFSFINL